MYPKGPLFSNNFSSSYLQWSSLFLIVTYPCVCLGSGCTKIFQILIKGCSLPELQCTHMKIHKIILIMIQYPHVPFKDQFADPNKKEESFCVRHCTEISENTDPRAKLENSLKRHTVHHLYFQKIIILPCKRHRSVFILKKKSKGNIIQEKKNFLFFL